MIGPVAARLPGDRLHLQHGPIDLIISADGAREQAFAAAWARFRTVLPDLCTELPVLRMDRGLRPTGQTARRMWHAVNPHQQDGFLTPMAAVAGSVADEVLAAMTAAAPLTRAIVNNGGDIALHLARGQSARVAITSPAGESLGLLTVRDTDPVRGIATSGRGGRSFSLGIADAVTVLAPTAAMADAAATVIANAVDLAGHPAVTRTPAHHLAPDSDLGPRLVTTGLGPLTERDIAAALDRGLATARALHRRGLITAAALFLRGQSRMTDPVLIVAEIPRGPGQRPGGFPNRPDLTERALTDA